MASELPAEEQPIKAVATAPHPQSSYRIHLIVQQGMAQPSSFRTTVRASSFMGAWAEAVKVLAETIPQPYTVLSYGSCYRVIEPGATPEPAPESED